MATVVEHDKRKHEILKKALDVFVQEGYEDVTFQKIADRCGITRTTLYIYFKNKREIFLFSIKQLTEGLEVQIESILKDSGFSNEKKLRDIFSLILDAVDQNKDLFTILLPYLLSLKKTGVDSGERVRRRVIRLRHIIALILIQGIKAGEFKKQNVRDTNEILYGLIEASIFRLVVMNQQSVTEMRDVMSLAIDNILIK